MPFFLPEFWMTVLAGFSGLCLGWPALYFVYQKWGLKVFTCLSLFSVVSFFVGLYYLYGWFSPPPPSPSMIPPFSTTSSSMSMVMMPESSLRGDEWAGEKVISADRVWVYHSEGCYPGVEGRDYNALPGGGGVFSMLADAQVAVGEESLSAPGTAVPVGAGVVAGLLFGLGAAVVNYGPSLVSAVCGW